MEEMEAYEGADGAGLACAVFEYLLELGDKRPKVVGATHYHGEHYLLKTLEGTPLTSTFRAI